MSAHPPAQLRSRKPLWLDLTTSDTKTRWQEVRDSAIVSNKALVSDPTVQQPGFELHHHTRSLLNRFRANTGLCAANLQKWCLTSSNKCQCGERQTMIHIVEPCPWTKFTDKGLILCHEADDNAVK